MYIILQALALSVLCSLDCFATGFAYGAAKVKIPVAQALLINFLCALVLGVSLLLGSLVGAILPEIVAVVACMVILTGLGIKKFIDGFRHKGASEERNISRTESSALMLALTVDEIAIGFGTGIVGLGILSNVLNVVFCLVFAFIFLLVGRYIGHKAAKRTTVNLSWLAGIILILLAVSKIFMHH